MPFFKVHLKGQFIYYSQQRAIGELNRRVLTLAGAHFLTDITQQISDQNLKNNGLMLGHKRKPNLILYLTLVVDGLT